MVEPVEMTFGLKTPVGQWNHVLDGVHISTGRGNFKAESAALCKVLRHSAVICAKSAEPIEMPFRLWARMGQGIMYQMGSRCLLGKGHF